MTPSPNSDTILAVVIVGLIAVVALITAAVIRVRAKASKPPTVIPRYPTQVQYLERTGEEAE